jgi:Icc protein
METLRTPATAAGGLPAPGAIRLLQLSDPHLLADPRGHCRGLPPLACLQGALERSIAAIGGPPDLLLISGDLCHDESWGGYVRLREALAGLMSRVPVALLPGNHDHPLLLKSVLGRAAFQAPAWLEVGSWGIALLDSHLPGRAEGLLDADRLSWLEARLRHHQGPVLLALHHHPVDIGDPLFDAIALRDSRPLHNLVARNDAIRVIVFGHIHQHWSGRLALGSGPALLGCPSTLRQVPPVQACPLQAPGSPGGRLLELGPDGRWRDRLLRWPAPSS